MVRMNASTAEVDVGTIPDEFAGDFGDGPMTPERTNDSRTTAAPPGVSHVLNSAQKIHRWLTARGQATLLVFGAGMVTVVGVLDRFTGPQIGLALLYLLPISLVAWLAGRGAGFVIALASAMVWLVADLNAVAPYSSPVVLFCNTLLRLGIFVLFAHLLSRLRQVNRRLAEAVEQRTIFLNAEIVQHKRAEQERQRLVYDLHDGVCQLLTGTAFKAKLLRDSLEAESLPHVEDTQQIVGLINDAVGQIVGMVKGLAPPAMEENDLLAGLRRLAAETEALFGAHISVSANQQTLQVSTGVGLHLFRIAQEAVHNAIRHGGVQEIDVKIKANGSQLCLMISDGGKGFFPKHRHEGLGLRTMRHRARLISGLLIVASEPGRGTTIQCSVPNTRTAADALESR